ncbi:MAG: MOSC domain-containing protein [Thermomicrobiales bacterium]
MPGEVIAIHIALAASEPMQALQIATAFAGQGLEGDRYRNGVGFYSDVPTDPGARELTLIAEEALAAVTAETGIQIPLHEHRRNITTRGIDVDALLGQQFRIGDVVCEGVRACPPCNHLDELTGKPLLKPLARRGGLRARIVTGGDVRVGDRIEPLAAPAGAAPVREGFDGA